MDLEFTPEQVQKHINNCFDSWDICEKYSVMESLDEEQNLEYCRNIEHIQIQLNNDWFVEGCTSEQKEKLEKYNTEEYKEKIKKD